MICGSRLSMVSPGVGKSEDGAFYLTQAMGGGMIHGLIAFGLLAADPALRSDSLASPTHFVEGGGT
jgi:hypothetical protein